MSNNANSPPNGYTFLSAPLKLDEYLSDHIKIFFDHNKIFL